MMSSELLKSRLSLCLGLLFAACLSVSACSDEGGSGDECSSRDDCSNGQVCRDGSCVTPDDPDTGDDMDASMDPDGDSMDPDTSADIEEDTDGTEDMLAVETVTLDDGSTAKTFGVDTEGRADFVPEVAVTENSVYLALHAEGNPVSGATILEDLGYLVKFNRSDNSLAWARRVEPERCETQPYDIEVADDGTIFTLSDYRNACSEGVSVSIAAPLYVRFNPDGSVADRDRRTDPRFCYRSLSLAPNASSLIGGGQSNCRQDSLAQYPLFGRINSDLSSQTPRELSGGTVGGGWIRDVVTLDNGFTVGAGDIPPENNNDSPQPFFSTLNTNNSVGTTSKYSSSGLDVEGVAANADNIYIFGTQVTGNNQATLLVASRSDGSFQPPLSLGNSPSTGQDIVRGPNGNFWTLSNPDGGLTARIDELTPGNLSSPTTTDIGFSGTSASSVTPNALGVGPQEGVAIGGTWELAEDDTPQAFIRLPNSGN